MKNIYEINDCPLFTGLKDYEQYSIFHKNLLKKVIIL